MSPTEFRIALAALGLTQAAFARLIDYQANAVNNWARGRSPVPVVVAKYLELRLELGELTRALETLRSQASRAGS